MFFRIVSAFLLGLMVQSIFAQNPEPTGVLRNSFRINTLYVGHDLFDGIIKADEFRLNVGGVFPLGKYGGGEFFLRESDLNYSVGGLPWDEDHESSEQALSFFLRDYDRGLLGLGYTRGNRERSFDYPELGLVGSWKDDYTHLFVQMEYFLDIYTILLRKGRFDVDYASDTFIGSGYKNDYFTLGARWYLSNTTRVSLLIGGGDASDYRRVHYLAVPNSLERKWGFVAGFDHLDDRERIFLGVTYFFNGKPTVLDRDRRYDGIFSVWDSDLDTFEQLPAIEPI
ncbi:MAG: hypothetical protein OEZ23_04885 [Gammaproteobacteria bacterium]|nr:hypothetical protein [Gammaproteobacteria bacterium]